MSIGALGAFAQGLGGGMKLRQDEKARDEEGARMDRYIAAMEQSRQGGGYGAVPQGGISSGADGSLFGLIDQTEGGGQYNTLFGHSQNGGRFAGVDVSDMTLGQLYDFSNPTGEYGQWVKGNVGHVATPMGRYQIVGTTLRNTADAMGLPADTKFSPAVQDSMARYLATNRLGSAKSQIAKRAALRAEWEGFKNVSDEALDAAIANFNSSGPLPHQRGMGAIAAQQRG